MDDRRILAEAGEAGKPAWYTVGMMTNPLSLLETRRSVPARQLGAPGPDPAQLDALLRAAVRVPDHGKLVPFRLLLLRGAARARLGAALAELQQRKEPNAAPAAIEKSRERFNAAPLIVVVIARTAPDHPKVPEQEQILAAGCVAYNLLLGAHALGFAAQWLTGWSAYDRDAAAILGLAANERVIGYVHVGTPAEAIPDRDRPDAAALTAEWTG